MLEADYGVVKGVDLWDPANMGVTTVYLAKGLNASPGAATGKAIFDADRAERLAQDGQAVILVRPETSPDDVHGMLVAQGILTQHGGATSHAAVVARGWGKCCVVGAGALHINLAQALVTVDGTVLREGDVITVNGTKGTIYSGALPLVKLDPEKNRDLQDFLGWCDGVRTLGVRTNADSPGDAAIGRRFGAAGIGRALLANLAAASGKFNAANSPWYFIAARS